MEKFTIVRRDDKNDLPFDAAEIFISHEIDQKTRDLIGEILQGLGFDYMNDEEENGEEFTRLANGERVDYWAAIGKGFWQK